MYTKRRLYRVVWWMAVKAAHELIFSATTDYHILRIFSNASQLRAATFIRDRKSHKGLSS